MDFSSFYDVCEKSILHRAKDALANSTVELQSENPEEYDCIVNNVNSVWISKKGNWVCDCIAPKRPCIHIAICILSIEKKTYTKKVIPPGHMRYKLQEDNIGITLSRKWVLDEEEMFIPNNAVLKKEDHKIQRIFQQELNADVHLTKEQLQILLEILADFPTVDLTINNIAVMPSTELASPVGLVQDHPEGFILKLIRDPKIKGIFKNDLVLYNTKTTKDTSSGTEKLPEIRIFEQKIDSLRYNVFARGIVYNHDEVDILVCKAIPELKEKVKVLSSTTKLPIVKSEKPYILMETIEETYNNSSVQSLRVMAKIVYGKPPFAEIRNNIVHKLSNIMPMRDITEETRLVEMYKMVKHAESFPLNITQEISIQNIGNTVQILNNMSKIKDIVLTGFAKNIAISDAIIPTVEIANNDFQIDWQGADVDAIFEAWQQNQNFLLSTDGVLRPIPVEWLEENGHLVRELLLAKQNAGNKKLPMFALFDLAKLCENLHKPPPPNLANLHVLVGDFTGIPKVTLPIDIQATLRDYQHDGVSWLAFLKNTEMGGILADDMGLGKTLQSLCILEKQSLVVVPTSVLHNWQKEIEKFRPSLSVCIYHGTQRNLDTDADVILTTYAILRNDIEILEKILWNIVVLDEAQAIKNPKSHTALAAFKIQSKFRLTLTGTPIENRLTELWSQMHFLCPGLLGGYSDFVKQYEQAIIMGNTDAAKRLRQKIKPFILRRIKKDVVPELPPRSNQILYCHLGTEEKNIYDAVRAATQENIVRQLQEGTLNVMNALEALLRLRQAACHTGLLPGQVANTSSKVTALMEKLEEVVNSGHKALVFSQWTSLLDLIEPHLKEQNINFVRLDGSTQNRQDIVDQFQTSPEISIFLASLRAGGMGLNLTEADHVFLVDPWWNPAVEDQAADRAHRIGQTKPVIVYRLVAKDTVEEKILVLQDKKRQLAETALGDASQGSMLTKEDILALLQ